MKGRFKDVEHLVRAALLFCVGLIVFSVARGLLIPKDFGEVGHFRTGALADNQAHPIVYAGRESCEGCHGEVLEVRKGSKHDRMSCEACHGPLAAHAEDPASVKPTLPEATPLCGSCHERSSARPSGFPQVDGSEHSGGEPCQTCHRPHHPEIE